MPYDQSAPYLLAFTIGLLGLAALALLADYLASYRVKRHQRRYMRGIAERYGRHSNRYKRERYIASSHPRARYMRPY